MRVTVDQSEGITSNWLAIMQLIAIPRKYGSGAL